MAICAKCKENLADRELQAGLTLCAQCMKGKYSRALSNYVMAMSEEVVQVPFGWCTALCALGDPMQWLCLHIHDSEGAARVCLVETVVGDGGMFPIR